MPVLFKFGVVDPGVLGLWQYILLPWLREKDCAFQNSRPERRAQGIDDKGKPNDTQACRVCSSRILAGNLLSFTADVSDTVQSVVLSLPRVRPTAIDAFTRTASLL